MFKEEINLETVSSLNRKLTAVAHVGGWSINLYDTTFTKQQIKFIKEYFNIDIENLEDK